MQEYLDIWQNYFDFSGRTSRRGYWMAVLLNFLISIIIDFAAGLLSLGILSRVYSIAIIIPMLAVGVRRLRDGGYHWAWIFINLIPLVGWIVYLVLLCQPGSSPPRQSSHSDPYDDFGF